MVHSTPFCLLLPPFNFTTNIFVMHIDSDVSAV